MLDMETLENAGLTPEEKLQLVLLMGLFWGFDNHIKSKIGRQDGEYIYQKCVLLNSLPRYLLTWRIIVKSK